MTMPRWWSSLLLLCAALVVAAILSEFILRAFELAPAKSVFTVTSDQFERVPGLFTPGQDLVDTKNPDLPHRVRINRLGYRGSEFPVAKAPGEYRIVMVGDSFTFGDFVEDDETLPAQLATALAGRCDNVRVINAGVGGTTIVTQARMVERALRLEPDLVVLTFFENDIDDLAAPLWYALAENRRIKSAFPFSVVYPLARNTALWNFALHARARLSLSMRASARAAPAPPPVATGPAGSPARADYARQLEDLRDALARSAVRFVYAAYPSHHAVSDPGRRELLDWVGHTAHELGLDFISLLDSQLAAALPVETLYLRPLDGHPAPIGYRHAATALATHLAGADPGTCELR